MIPTHFSAPAPVGLSADGRALGDGEGLTVLREAMVLLDLAQAETGSARAPALCHALTEAARALAGVHAYAPAESHLAQALRWAATMGGHDLCADLECAWSEVATNAADLADVRGEQAASRAARGPAPSTNIRRRNASAPADWVSARRMTNSAAIASAVKPTKANK